ncbi:hypothetical protein EWM64_g7269 [Hericium alpestre]|uniref:BD-FAE-like domain-containing protein n=1 Tax=Hericium alpestre TaxID=135208 RepID=A0A4Y9ZTC4_9AGAM|nr:hypothetical protein EWM64_g7269 [Hericium alpestre]
MDQFLDLPYVTLDEGKRDSFREFDLYVPRAGKRDDGQPPPLICFVHGGAWRSEDKVDYGGLAQKLAAYTGCAVAVPNYRLTPREPTADNYLHHPAHAEDVLQFLQYLQTWSGPEGSNASPLFDRARLFLVGHSCSAHMLPAIVLNNPSDPSLEPPVALLHSVKGIILSEGIYDVDTLLKKFPDYRDWFIANTFGDRESFADFAVSTYPHREGGSHIRYLIIHSSGDTLVNQEQSQLMYDHLLSLGDNGREGGKVSRNFGDLTGEHSAILQGDDYVHIVGDFVLSNI